MFTTITSDLLDFIQKSPSCFHVVKNLSDLLLNAGFTSLAETKDWNITPGGRYFVTRNDSSIIAFTVPSDTPHSLRITAAHSDSPSFRIKHDPEILSAGSYVTLNVEKYGGAIISPWLDRPLSVAGRVIAQEGDVLTSHLINVDRDLVMIPNLAIHMDRSINEGHAYKVQSELLPLLGDETSQGSFIKIIAEAAGVTPEQVRYYDLYLYNRVPGTVWGANSEYISSGKLDDLQCAYSAVRALAESAAAGTLSNNSLCMSAVFDNEEVGSRTKQGADATFLTDTYERICEALGMSRSRQHALTASGFMISADNAHALHPLHTGKADPVHRPLMNHGPVIKFSANQKYTTDAVSASVFAKLCDEAGVPHQTFFNHSDQPGGSTLGNLSNAHLAMDTVDIGLAQLAMHSPYETAGAKDTAYLARVFAQFYHTDTLFREN